ncbi:aminotransferase class V-fold PLP-dependent enzyme [Phenylobacterium sp.]|jgi:cysteine desulfurase|uniref:cysteine desulfurase family protein n=1 Tax=Phenylobacterium sp. TaxID=1871053 RepID=UPI000C920F5F|nr:aminotransferase class V-fold PLP-dependent enzyme [Phenylobacterium sp.]MAK80880.1 aminotransferase [Phenylobacterium sp.]|tara:strand:+ start:78288 stop:79430 length:1143 start_codon:yes stop_codon:yes gene_type:complete
MKSVYLDHNATSPIRPEALEAATAALMAGGNPSSVHAAGRAARARVEQARSQVAALIGAPASTVVFTSGGTEANALAIDSAVAGGARRLLISAIEHDAVLETAKASGAAVELLPVRADGRLDLDALASRLATWDAAEGPPFVALMLANNETGVIQPVAEAAVLVREAGGWLHVDAVQAVGRVAIDSRALGADTLALSSHKLGGPGGAGALTFGPRAKLVRRLHGGGQERGRRAGTENVAGLAGFGAAAEAALRDLEAAAAQAEWRDAAEAALVAAGAVSVGGQAPRLPNTLCVAAPGFPAELQVMTLDLAGIMVSAGSACSSGKVKASHVLMAMGLDQLAGAAIRVSGGWSTGAHDWKHMVEAWITAYDRHAARRRAPAA